VAGMAEVQRLGSRADTDSSVEMWPRPAVSIQGGTGWGAIGEDDGRQRPEPTFAAGAIAKTTW
jgi:hypothetical protein